MVLQKKSESLAVHAESQSRNSQGEAEKSVVLPESEILSHEVA